MLSLINIICFVIPFPSARRTLRQKLKSMWYARTNNLKKFSYNFSGKPVVIWFDHVLGGGTEVYSKRQFKKMEGKYDVMRIQYFPKTNLYHLVMANNKHKIFTTDDIFKIYDFCRKLNITEIVVNNLVAYKSTTDVFNFIHKLKNNNKNTPRVSFRGHDFHCICPSYNLINCDGKFCNIKYKNGCEECWKRKKINTNNGSNSTLKQNIKSILDWRYQWGKFFSNTVDDIIVFSDAAAEIFLTAFPQIKIKIQIIPHDVNEYRHVNIPKHNCVNIAVLGAISEQKGARVIKYMAQELKTNKQNVNIIIIGTIEYKIKNIKVTGKYKPSKLPKIMEKYFIDIVFIPSVWPETFSYTTSEAMSMGLPVACFDMGAPAERVRKYKYGLVLDEIQPKKNLDEIVNFVKKHREI